MAIDCNDCPDYFTCPYDEIAQYNHNRQGEIEWNF